MQKTADAIDFPAEELSRINEIWLDLVGMLPLMGIALVILAITWLGVKLAGRAANSVLLSRGLRPVLRNFLITIMRFFIWLLGIMLALAIVFPSVTPAKLLTALGLGSIAIGLAFQDIFENFLAGIMIMLRRPMRVGDFIECETITGTIEDITIRDTYIRRTDNQLAIIPNSMLYKNPVHVLTDLPLRKWEITVGVGYDHDIGTVEDVIRKAVQTLDIISNEQPVEVFASELAPSSVNLTVWWWGEARPINALTTRDRAIRAIKEACDREGIELPNPYQTLVFKEPLKIGKAPE